MIEDRSHEAETFFASEDVENNSVSETSKSVDSADSTADISTPSHAEGKKLQLSLPNPSVGKIEKIIDFLFQ